MFCDYFASQSSLSEPQITVSMRTHFNKEKKQNNQEARTVNESLQSDLSSLLFMQFVD